MSYVSKVIQPGETLLYSGSLHWVVYGPAIALAVIAAGFGALALARPDFADFATVAAGLTFILALPWFLGAWIKRWSTEIAVTDRRVIFKQGLIRRKTIEMNMDKVESVDVDQSLFGRLLNFGDVTVRGTGAGLEPLRDIGAPIEFRNRVIVR